MIAFGPISRVSSVKGQPTSPRLRRPRKGRKAETRKGTNIMNKPNIRFRKKREDMNTAIENAYSQRPGKNCYQRWLPIARAALLVITLSLVPRVIKAAPDNGGPAGLWSTVVHAPDNSFSFPAFELWGSGGTFIGSGQPDLTPAALGSSAWGVWRRIGPRQFRVIARFWTYDP